MIIPLSDRELACLEGLARGLSYREIGDEIYLSPWTVKIYMKSLFRKLEARSGPHAVARGYQFQLLT